MTRQDITRVNLLPNRSTNQVSMIVHPIFNVLSIPPIISVVFLSIPRLMKIDGR
jgi:hypothetical protein